MFKNNYTEHDAFVHVLLMNMSMLIGVGLYWIAMQSQQ